MEIKGLATAVIFWLILNNFLPWLRLLIMTLTTHNNAGMLCNPHCFCVLTVPESPRLHITVCTCVCYLLLWNEYVDKMYVSAAHLHFSHLLQYVVFTSCGSDFKNVLHKICYPFCFRLYIFYTFGIYSCAAVFCIPLYCRNSCFFPPKFPSTHF